MLKTLSAHCVSSKERVLESLQLAKSLIFFSHRVPKMSSHCIDSNGKETDVDDFIARCDDLSRKASSHKSKRGTLKTPAIVEEINGEITKTDGCYKLRQTPSRDMKGKFVTNWVKRLKFSIRSQKRKQSPAIIRRSLRISARRNCENNPVKQPHLLEDVGKSPKSPEIVRRKSLRISSQEKYKKEEIYPECCYIAQNDTQYRKLLRLLNSTKMYHHKRTKFRRATVKSENSRRKK